MPRCSGAGVAGAASAEPRHLHHHHHWRGPSFHLPRLPSLGARDAPVEGGRGEVSRLPGGVHSARHFSSSAATAVRRVGQSVAEQRVVLQAGAPRIKAFVWQAWPTQGDGRLLPHFMVMWPPYSRPTTKFGRLDEGSRSKQNIAGRYHETVIRQQ